LGTPVVLVGRPGTRPRGALRRPPGGAILGPHQGEEEVRRVSEGSRGSGSDRVVGEPEPAFRGGGLPLPGLKRLRLRRGFSQAELALRAGLSPDYLFKVESGRRGCNPEAARELAAVLEVDLRELRIRRDDAEEAQAAPNSSRPRVAPRVAYRQVHQAYLRIMLLGAVGSAYAAMEEWEIEKHSGGSPWGEVIGVVRARKREIEALGEVMQDERVSVGLSAEVRSFLEAVLGSYPDQDIRLLAAARGRETSEEGRQALTEAMRELL
jgi:transcriptional regulator with XRE-family HTH domain